MHAGRRALGRFDRRRQSGGSTGIRVAVLGWAPRARESYGDGGDTMLSTCHLGRLTALIVLGLFAATASAQSFRVQCPPFTNLHPDPGLASTQDAIAAANSAAGNPTPVLTYADVFPGKVKCQEIAGGDGFATMGDGHQIYLFGFGPLSGIGDMIDGKAGTETADIFNQGDDLANHPNGAMTEPADIMNQGVLSSNEPAPLIALDEGDELYLTLSNVGQIMRPDLFEQHTVHFHGYPNASGYYDGVPDASIAINVSGSFTYYYTAPDAGTYMWHCHIAPPEHLQMGMVGQIFVRPKQDRLADGAYLYAALRQSDLVAPPSGTTEFASASATDPLDTPSGCKDLLCSYQTALPSTPDASTVKQVASHKYAYNDGDGSTEYDVDVPIQLMDFDPNFHFVGMTFNPEAFVDMKSKYFMLNGRSYPDTISPGALYTQGPDGVERPSQPLPSLITLDKTNGKTRALLRLSDLSVTQETTLASPGIPMKVIALNSRLLRDGAGNNMYYDTNSITLGGGEALDAILDVSGSQYNYCETIAGGCHFFLYTTNLNRLSNDAENLGGMMTEVVVK
jgi:hypothetical protein